MTDTPDSSTDSGGSAESAEKKSSARKPDRWKRHRTRVALVQALYQWQFSAPATHELEQQFATAGKLKKVDRGFFRTVLKVLMHRSAEFDELLAPVMTRTAEELGKVERGILLLGCYELRDCPEIPYRVVISEAVELAKSYGAEDSHKFVNAVLDKLATTLRPVEAAAAAS